MAVLWRNAVRVSSYHEYTLYIMGMYHVITLVHPVGSDDDLYRAICDEFLRLCDLSWRDHR